MPLKRKRKRKLITTSNEDEAEQVPPKIQTIRTLIPPSSEIFLLESFLKRYAPRMNLVDSVTPAEIRNIVISPLDTIVEAPHIVVPTCREPLPSLVDDVVWDLVMRRDRFKRLGLETGKNVLAQGYVSQSIEGQNGAQLSLQMRPGVVCIQPNDKVSLCKSRTFQILHCLVGDDLLRMMLLHTRLFVPLEKDLQNPQGNFILVCGPPLVSAYKMQPNGYFENVIKTPTETANQQANGIKKTGEGDSLRMEANAKISNYSLRYSNEFIPKIGLQKNHPLNTALASEKLLDLMVDLYNEKGIKRKKRWKRVRVHGIDICSQIQWGHSKCDYARILERYCPLPSSLKMDGNSDITLPMLVRDYTPPEKVASFIASVLKKVFPATFWGSEGNFSKIIESVQYFVRLRRKEHLTNKRLMNGIRITKMGWLMGAQRKGSSMPRSEHQAVTSLTLMVFRWVFQGYLIPLLRANFYVTDSEFKSNQLLFYRRPVWSMFRSLSMKKLLKKQFSELSAAEAQQLLRFQRMGFSRLRLLPKSTGVRPIAQLGRPPVSILPEDRNSTTGGEQTNSSFKHKGGDHENSSEENRPCKRRKVNDLDSNSTLNWKVSNLPPTNVVLSEVFHVLNYECGQQERPFGAGLSGLEDFYPIYRQYILDLKKLRGKRLDLYFTSVDIEKCYDNINQKYLFNLVKSMISEDNYFIQQFNMFQSNKVNGRLEKISKKIAAPMHQDYQEVAKKFKGVVFDSRNCNLVSKKKILELLEEHLHSNLVVVPSRNGNRKLLQSSGISQGSILSMTLCNLYYGDIESKLFEDSSRLTLPPNLLARLVDDFIFISTKKEAMCSFLEKMYKGKPELGVKINQEKTLVSESIRFKSRVDDGTVSWDQVEKSTLQWNKKDLFPWCGMLFDTITGEVFVDYSRFHDGKARDALTVLHGSEGQMLSFKMKSFVRPRCSPILYDSSINSLNTIVTNYYQMMLLGAVKTAEYLRHSGMSQSSNLNFLLSQVDDLTCFASKQIKSNLSKKRYPDRSCHFVLTDDISSWVCWRAFLDVFSYLTDFGDFQNAISIKVSSNKQPPKMRRRHLEETLELALKQFELSKMLDFEN